MNNQCTKGALLVFTKAPVRGHVKTRLIPSIGRRHATSIYQEILTKTLSTARKSNFSSIQIWVDGEVEHAYFKRLKSRHKVKFYKQKAISAVHVGKHRTCVNILIILIQSKQKYHV